VREEKVQGRDQKVRQEKQTVGAASLALKEKSHDPINPIDLQREVHQGTSSAQSWEAQIIECLERGKREYPADFYLVVLLRKERVLDNVLRQMFFPRKSCPTPNYDQTVFRYHRGSDALEFLWTIPDEATCVFLLDNYSLLSPEEKSLADMVQEFADGDLLREAAKLNGEICV